MLRGHVVDADMLEALEINLTATDPILFTTVVANLNQGGATVAAAPAPAASSIRLDAIAKAAAAAGRAAEAAVGEGSRWVKVPGRHLQG